GGVEPLEEVGLERALEAGLLLDAPEMLEKGSGQPAFVQHRRTERPHQTPELPDLPLEPLLKPVQDAHRPLSIPPPHPAPELLDLQIQRGEVLHRTVM